MAKFSHDTLKTHCTGISIGMFAADLGNLRQAAHDVASWGCKFAHFDIMDGVFVPQMTGGPGFLKTVGTDMFRDVHMMVENPTSHVTSYVKAGADIITIQAESQNPADAISTLRAVAEQENRTVLAGISLVPATALDDIAHLLDMKPDLLLVLSLDPRDKNPPNIAATCARVQELRNILGPVLNGGPVLAFDGGVTAQSIAEISACNPDMIVSGSAILGAPDPHASYKMMSST